MNPKLMEERENELLPYILKRHSIPNLHILADNITDNSGYLIFILMKRTIILLLNAQR